MCSGVSHKRVYKTHLIIEYHLPGTREILHISPEEGTNNKEQPQTKTSISTQPLQLQEATDTRQAKQQAGKSSNRNPSIQFIKKKLYSRDAERKILYYNVYHYVCYLCIVMLFMILLCISNTDADGCLPDHTQG